MIANDDEFVVFQEETNPFDRIPRRVTDQWPSVETSIGHDHAAILRHDVGGDETQQLKFFQLNLIVEKFGQRRDRLNGLSVRSIGVVHRVQRLIVHRGHGRIEQMTWETIDRDGLKDEIGLAWNVVLFTESNEFLTEISSQIGIERRTVGHVSGSEYAVGQRLFVRGMFGDPFRPLIFQIGQTEERETEGSLENEMFRWQSRRCQCVKRKRAKENSLD